MAHALKGDRQRHAALEEVRKLPGERGQLRELRSALTAAPERSRKGRCQATALLVLVSRRNDGDARLRGVDHHGEQPEPFDLRERRGAIRHVQHSLHDLPGAATGLVRKLCHILSIYLTT